MLEFAGYLALAWVALLALLLLIVLVAAVVIRVLPDDRPLLSLLDRRPIVAPRDRAATIYSLELERARRRSVRGGAA